MMSGSMRTDFLTRVTQKCVLRQQHRVVKTPAISHRDDAAPSCESAQPSLNSRMRAPTPLLQTRALRPSPAPNADQRSEPGSGKT